MKRIKSKPSDSNFSLRVALPPQPGWHRRGPSPDPTRGRSEPESVELRLVAPNPAQSGQG